MIVMSRVCHEPIGASDLRVLFAQHVLHAAYLQADSDLRLLVLLGFAVFGWDVEVEPAGL